MWVKHTEQPEIQPFSDQKDFWSSSLSTSINSMWKSPTSFKEIQPTICWSFPHDEIRPELWKVVDEIRVFARMTPQGKVGRVEGLGGTGWTSQTNDAAKC